MGDDARPEPRAGTSDPTGGPDPPQRHRPDVKARGLPEVLKRWPILAAGGALGLVVLIAVIVALTGGPPPGPDPVIYQEGHNPFLEAAGPTCIGMPLGRGTVVYSIDSSSALAYSFDAIRSAIGRSLDTLRAGQRFGLVVWKEGQPRVLAMAANTPAARDAAIKLLDEVQPVGSTDATGGLRAGVRLEPDVLCVIAAKGPEQDDVDALAAQIRDHGIVFRCLALRDDAPTLTALADKTGGSYQRIDPQDLNVWLAEAQ